ncbi:hypothetical protein [Streptomyces rubrogriseus]|uniref:hypothetical protein n=1 Tax=Streptomyces rubrogriseus TaxID=194673 RepID=UPI0037CE8FC2
MRTESLGLPAAVARYYGTDSPGAGDRVCQRRYTLFYADRFDSSSSATQTLARNLLLGRNSDIAVIAGTWFLISGVSLDAADRPENTDPTIRTAVRRRRGSGHRARWRPHRPRGRGRRRMGLPTQRQRLAHGP